MPVAIYRSNSSTYPQSNSIYSWKKKKCHECIHYQVFLNEAQVRKSGSHIVHIPIDTYDFACQFNMQIMFTFVYCKLSKAPSYALIAFIHTHTQPCRIVNTESRRERIRTQLFEYQEKFIKWSKHYQCGICCAAVALIRLNKWKAAIRFQSIISNAL